MLAALTQFTHAGADHCGGGGFMVGQILEGFVLVPYLVGDRIGLHPLSVIFCPDGVWPAVRFCRRAAGVARQRGVAGRAARHATPAAGSRGAGSASGSSWRNRVATGLSIVLRIRHGSGPADSVRLFAPTPASFDSFVVGDNAEVVTSLYALTDRASPVKPPPAVAIWAGLLSGRVICWRRPQQRRMLTIRARPCCFAAGDAFPPIPSCSARLICVDDADRLTAVQQGWLFTAFNHRGLRWNRCSEWSHTASAVAFT